MEMGRDVSTVGQDEGDFFELPERILEFLQVHGDGFRLTIERILSTCKVLQAQWEEPKLLLSGQEGGEEFGQAVVARLVDVELVLVPDPGGGFAVGAEQNGG